MEISNCSWQSHISFNLNLCWLCDKYYRWQQQKQRLLLTTELRKQPCELMELPKLKTPFLKSIIMTVRIIMLLLKLNTTDSFSSQMQNQVSQLRRKALKLLAECECLQITTHFKKEEERNITETS